MARNISGTEAPPLIRVPTFGQDLVLNVVAVNGFNIAISQEIQGDSFAADRRGEA
jgi:hypothetical protein